MFIIDQFQTTLEDGTLHVSDEESVSDISPSILRQGELAESTDRRRRHLWSGPFLTTHTPADEVAMTSARLFLPPRQCSMIVDTGPDFPLKFRNQLESLGSEMTWFRPRDNLTTRALNIYSGSTIGYVLLH